MHVATLDGHRFVVTARVVVLAAGGVENARLLLAADSQQVRGLGNGSDCVGRFFMEHAEAAVGQILLTDPAAARQLDVVRHRQAVLCLSEASQRAHEVLNVSLQLLEPEHLEASEAGGVPLAIGDTLGRIDGHPAAATTIARAPYVRCYIRTEVAPNPESRVTLTYDTDALGMRRPDLVWRMGRLESRSIIQTLEVIGAALGSRALGRMLIDIDDSAARSSLGFPPWAGVHSSMHHMGTTRMSAAPADGVVDANCRVHAISNLYIAGSSVFPAVGFANPTFTIVALALRLADHLAAVLDRG